MGGGGRIQTPRCMPGRPPRRARAPAGNPREAAPARRRLLSFLSFLTQLFPSLRPHREACDGACLCGIQHVQVVQVEEVAVAAGGAVPRLPRSRHRGAHQHPPAWACFVFCAFVLRLVCCVLCVCRAGRQGASGRGSQAGRRVATGLPASRQAEPATAARHLSCHAALRYAPLAPAHQRLLASPPAPTLSPPHPPRTGTLRPCCPGPWAAAQTGPSRARRSCQTRCARARWRCRHPAFPLARRGGPRPHPAQG